MAEDYIAFCEKIWRGWLDHRLTVSPLLRKVFELDAAPEPYVSFCAGEEPLVMLLTNPGGIMCHQCRAAVKAGDGPLSEKHKYAEDAPKLGCFYHTKLAGHPAGHRIDQALKLSSWIGCGGVRQVDLFPFHSQSLPKNKKDALLHEIKTDKGGLLGSYVEHLQEFLRGRPVVSPQAAPTRDSLTPRTPKSSPWLTWIAETAGLDLKNAEFVPLLVKRDSKTTAAAWVSKKKVRMALVLMMGTNNLPADEGLTRLAAALRKFWRLR